MNKLKFLPECDNGLITVRPKHFLKEIEDNSDVPDSVMLHFPSSDIGSLTTLEATMLASLIYLTEPKVIFEYGTFLGYSTALLLRNSNPDCKVFSIDLPNDGSNINTEFSEIVYKNDVENDNYLSTLQFKVGERYLKGMSSSYLSRLTLIKQNSINFNPNDYKLINCVDFIFIDGGHTKELITRDSFTANEMAAKGSIIVWHDYNSSIHRDVTDFVNEYSHHTPVYHIANTMLAFTIV
jgi:hypothetical protein